MLAPNANGVKLGVMDVNRVDSAWDVDLQNRVIMTNIGKGLSHQESKQIPLKH